MCFLPWYAVWRSSVHFPSSEQLHRHRSHTQQRNLPTLLRHLCHRCCFASRQHKKWKIVFCDKESLETELLSSFSHFPEWLSRELFTTFHPSVSKREFATRKIMEHNLRILVRIIAGDKILQNIIYGNENCTDRELHQQLLSETVRCWLQLYSWLSAQIFSSPNSETRSVTSWWASAVPNTCDSAGCAGPRERTNERFARFSLRVFGCIARVCRIILPGTYCFSKFSKSPQTTIPTTVQ